jgi:hypothetical protein
VADRRREGLRGIARALALAAGLALGCVVFSEHPIVGETPGVLDPALAGDWTELASDDDDDPRDVLTFTAHADHYVATVASSHAAVALTTAVVAGARYLSARTVGEEAQGYTLARYVVRGDRIAIAPLDYDAARRLVENGELAGTVAAEAPRSAAPDARAPVHLRATSGEIEQALRRLGPEALFPDLRDAWVRPTGVSAPPIAARSPAAH